MLSTPPSRPGISTTATARRGQSSFPTSVSHSRTPPLEPCRGHTLDISGLPSALQSGPRDVLNAATGSRAGLDLSVYVKAPAVSERVPSRTCSTFPATGREVWDKESTPSCRVRGAGWAWCAYSRRPDYARPAPAGPVVVNVIPARAVSGSPPLVWVLRLPRHSPSITHSSSSAVWDCGVLQQKT